MIVTLKNNPTKQDKKIAKLVNTCGVTYDDLVEWMKAYGSDLIGYVQIRRGPRKGLKIHFTEMSKCARDNQPCARLMAALDLDFYKGGYIFDADSFPESWDY